MAAVAGFFLGMAGFAAPAFGAATFGGWAVGASIGSTVVGGLVGKLLTSVALSALQQALTAKPSQGGGITISTTLRGEQNPETIILGRTATAGQAICPPYSHGKSNRWLTHVIELCSAPGATLERLILNDDYVEIGTAPMAGYEAYGLPILGDFEGGYAFIKYYNGSQTAADPMLLDKYGSHPDRPWTAGMIGAGLCYAILTFYYDQEIVPQVPRYRFEMSGIPLYDIRQDSTAGGSGSQRLSNPATWTQTDNPLVMSWNLMRGIPLPGGEIYGGGEPVEALPTATWMAAMNACDVAKPKAGGGTEPAYRAGLEIALSSPPASALQELLKAASATIADVGYAWKVQVGAPALPVYSFTDGDIIVSKPQDYDPFPSLSETYNGVAAQYPDPESLWETKEAPPRHNASWEAADVFGRRVADLSLPAVPYKRQVQRLMRAWIEDERRFRRHILTLPPDASAVELLDTTDWSSERNGYINKDFSVSETVEDLRTGLKQVSKRERDPADYDWSADFELPDTPGVTGTTVIVQPVSGFAVSAIMLRDAAAKNRRVALQLGWDSDLDARGIRWRIRLAGQPGVILRGDTQDVSEGGAIVSAGILPATSYEVAARLISGRKTAWGDWVGVTTADLRLAKADIDQTVYDDMAETAQRAGVTPVDALPASGEPNQIVMLLPDGVLYRWNASTGQWTRNLYAGIKAGDVDATKFASTIKPVEIVSSLPAAPHVSGRVVFLTTDGKLYRNSGTGWTSATAAADVSGQLTSAQIAALDAAKIAGQITSAQIGTGAVLADKLADAAVSVAKLADGAVTAAKLADAAVSTAKFAAGIRPVEIVASLPAPPHVAGRVVYLTGDGKLYRNSGTGWTSATAAADVTGQMTDAQIAALSAAKIAGQLTSAQIGTGAVLADKLADAAVSVSKLADGAVTAAKIADAAVSTAKFASGIRPVEIVASLPAAPHVSGRVVFLTTDGKIYRNSGTGWTAATAAADVSGQLTSAQIAALDAAKIAGQITSDQIGTGAVLVDKIASAAVTGVKIAAAAVTAVALAAGSVETDKLAANAVTAVKIAAGAVVAGKLSASAVTADTIAANAVTTAAIAAGAVTATEIAANAIVAGKIAAGAISAAEIAAGAITTAKLAAGAVTATELASNAVTAVKVAANAITAAKIEASAVTTAAIAAGAVTANEIAANAVTAVKIAAGAVVAGKLAASAVTADTIAANAVTTAAIAAGAVTANEIAANAIVAGKVAAGAISAAQLAAGAVTATRLAVGDWSNLVPASNFEDMAAWSLSAGLSKTNGPTPNGGQWDTPALIRVTNTDATGNRWMIGGWFPIPPTKALYAMARGRLISGTGNLYCYVQGVSDPVGGTAATLLAIGNITTTSITTVEASADMPSADYQYARFVVQVPATVGEFFLCNPTVRPKSNGNLIVDGAITAEKIAANAIVAGKIAANAVTTAAIAAGAVTANEIAADAITAVKIAAGAVVAGKLAASAVTADKIAANAVTTAAIAAGAVTANEIAANAIVAGKVAAGAISAAQIAAGAISATKLAVTNFFNVCLDYDCADEGYWDNVSNRSLISNGNAKQGRKALEISPVSPASNTASYSAMFDLEPAADYWVEVFGRNAATGGPTCSAWIQLFSVDAAGATTQTRLLQIGSWNGTAWTAYSTAFKTSDVEQRARLRFYRPGDATTVAGRFSSPRVLRRSDGSLVVDGTITAGKIDVGAITADKIAAGAVVASKIAAGAIQATHIQAGAISTTELIVDGAVSRRQLAVRISEQTVSAASDVSPAIVRAPFTIPAGSFRAYERDGKGDAKNPIIITYSLRGHSLTSSATTAYLALQYSTSTSGDIWNNLGNEVAIRLGGDYTEVNHVAMSIDGYDAGPDAQIETIRRLRLVAWKSGGTPNFVISGGTFAFAQQVNR